uniref:Uncharacterized protein n=1 Tax=Meloidogyne floridensis TaxID=298350 RepID=A0A915P0E8_9BILA
MFSLFKKYFLIYFFKSKEIQRLSSSRLREIEILGTGQEINEEILKVENNNNGNSGIDNIPQICQGNSRICKFVACAAHNFKHDSNFANIQLAAQLLSDKKMRRTIGSNPSAIKDACKEHGLNNGQCGFIAKAFQLIDKFMSTIEDNQENQKQINKMSDSVLVDENNEQELIKRLEEERSRTWSINKTTNKQPPIITNLLNILNNKINEKELLNDSEAEEFADEDKEEKLKMNKINKYIPEEYLEQNELENWLNKRLKDKNTFSSNDYYDEIKTEKNKEKSEENFENLNDDENEEKQKILTKEKRKKEFNFPLNPSIDNCMEYLINSR